MFRHQHKKLSDPPLELPLWELYAGGTGAPDLGVKLETTVPWRPLGKSNLIRSPWSDKQTEDEPYIPTVMSVGAAVVGLEKAREPVTYFPEDLVQKAEVYLRRRMKAIWTMTPEDYVLPLDEAVLLLKPDKSPGYPYYYKHSTKGAVINDPETRKICDERVQNLLSGEEVPCYFTLTEKSELRPVEKVKAKKTRIFFASDVHHLITSKVLFDRQNEEMMQKFGQHPITLGIQMPGPQFVRAVGSLVRCNDGDLSGCDLRFSLRIARSIRNLRKAFLPTRFDSAVNHLYNTVYCGYAAGLGGLYRVFGNKSGWENTAHDNSLMLWMALIIACYHFFPDEDPEKILTALINGDDLVVKMFQGHFKDLCDWLRKYNTVIEAEDWNERPSSHVTFLSHHLESVFVPGFGDFVVAAGNLPKLLSSLNWVKRSPSLTFEESCVAHLLGIRLCLFPWQVHFDECDKILSDYLSQIEMTTFIRQALSARLNPVELARLHTRAEGFDFFSYSKLKTLNQVLKGANRLIKKSINYKDDKNQSAESKGKGKEKQTA